MNIYKIDNVYYLPSHVNRTAYMYINGELNFTVLTKSWKFVEKDVVVDIPKDLKNLLIIQTFDLNANSGGIRLIKDIIGNR